MEEVFERKVREKKQKLSDNEKDLEKRQNESKTRLEQLKQELEEKKAAYEQERLEWEAINHITIDELKRQSMESLDGKKSFKKGEFKGRQDFIRYGGAGDRADGQQTHTAKTQSSER